jgi:hypothetical protein
MKELILVKWGKTVTQDNFISSGRWEEISIQKTRVNDYGNSSRYYENNVNLTFENLNIAE